MRQRTRLVVAGGLAALNAFVFTSFATRGELVFVELATFLVAFVASLAVFAVLLRFLDDGPTR